MKVNFFNKKNVMLALLMVVVAFSGYETLNKQDRSEVTTVYLTNSTTGKTLDTINKVATNDTGYTFVNNTLFSVGYVECLFGTVKYNLKLTEAVPVNAKLRVRFLAADSSIRVEREGNTDLGVNKWQPLQWTITGTTGTGASVIPGTGTTYCSLTTALYGATASRLQFTDITGTLIFGFRMAPYRRSED